jgi:hypothetical protein
MNPDSIPAFPHDDRAQYNERAGMTLRDYFAAKAMQAFITGFLSGREPVGEADDQPVARRAYEVADAMLAAREIP